MFYTTIHTIHILAVLIYGGFLFVDIFFLSKMSQTLGETDTKKAREAIMIHVRKVVPYSLFVIVGTGIYMFTQVFGPVVDNSLSTFQWLLLLKAFLGMWLGIRGFNQKVFKINPILFTSHLFPFSIVIIIVILSQFMYLF